MSTDGSGDESDGSDKGIHESRPRRRSTGFVNTWKYAKFYACLTESQRRRLISITDPLPWDFMNGLKDPEARLAKGVTCFGVPGLHWNAVLVLARLMLNIWFVCHALYIVTQHRAVDSDQLVGSFLDPQGSFVVFHSNGTKICDPAFGHSECVHIASQRSKPLQFVVWVDFLAVLCSALIILVMFIRFLWFTPNLPKRCPFFFFIMPRVTGKLSTMSFLAHASFARFRSLFLEGECKLIAILLVSSMLPKGVLSRIFSDSLDNDAEEQRHQRVMEEMPEITTESLKGSAISRESTESSCTSVDEEFQNSERACAATCISYCLGVGVYVALFVMSLQALLVKLTILHFVTVRTWEKWGFAEWILVLGFVNQFAGGVDLDNIEINRILLFRFGGADVVWQARECRAVSKYFSVLGHRMSSTPSSCKGRMSALSMMTTFTASSLQKLLLDPAREKSSQHMKEVRFRMHDTLFGNMSANGGIPQDDITRRLAEAEAGVEREGCKICYAELEDIGKYMTEI